MQGRLSTEQILNAWEMGIDRGPIDRALVLLWAVDPDKGQHLPDLPLGLRDRQLLDLRRATFGDPLKCMTSCPHCEDVLELELSTQELLDNMPVSAISEVTIKERDFSLRPLSSRDLADASRCSDLSAAEILLRDRICGCESSALSVQLQRELDALIETQEAGAELGLALRCVTCQHSWSEIFDIAGFFWTELEATAFRLCAETTEIARAFGWSEKEILSFSPHRRRTYLNLARGE